MVPRGNGYMQAAKRDYASSKARFKRATYQNLWALKGACKLFLSQSIGSNTFQLFKHKNCRSHSFDRFVGAGLGGLWA